jgi:hypothetical protein
MPKTAASAQHETPFNHANRAHPTNTVPILCDVARFWEPRHRPHAHESLATTKTSLSLTLRSDKMNHRRLDAIDRRGLAVLMLAVALEACGASQDRDAESDVVERDAPSLDFEEAGLDVVESGDANTTGSDSIVPDAFAPDAGAGLDAGDSGAPSERPPYDPRFAINVAIPAGVPDDPRSAAIVARLVELNARASTSRCPAKCRRCGSLRPRTLCTR